MGPRFSHLETYEKIFRRASERVGQRGLKPRPPERVQLVIGALTLLWKTFPDMRLGQLIECALHKKFGPDFDIFSVEDDQMMEALCEFCGETSQASESSTSEEGETILP